MVDGGTCYSHWSASPSVIPSGTAGGGGVEESRAWDEGGDAQPYAKYFIVNSTNGPFTATHNVQVKSQAGTVFTFR